jgi:hypothetical protein
VLGGPVEDMAAFELEGGRVDTEQEITDQTRREDAFSQHED